MCINTILGQSFYDVLFFRSIGYNEVTSRTINLKNSMHAATPGFLADGLLDDEGTQRLIPRPDVSQMIPFKPKLNAYPGEHPVPGNSILLILHMECVLSQE